MKLVSRFTSVFDRILDIFTVFAGSLLLFVVASVCLGIVMRAMGRPLAWVLEVSEYSLIYIAFLIAAWVLRVEGHVGIDIVTNQLKPRTRSLLITITSAICAVICAILTWYGAKVTWKFVLSGEFVVSVLEPPKYIFLAIIAVGSFLLLIQFIRRTVIHAREWRRPLEKELEPKLEHEI
jgi:TRAP-type C4-dicarboxylate transport system permease small subunit